MNAHPPTSRGWRRVSRQSPCSVCGRADWCTFTSDGTAACCMRVESQRPLKNGGWLHRLSEPVHFPPTPIRAGDAAKALAPVEQRDRVYRLLARELGLLPRHEDHLRQARSLPTPAIESFASTPPRAFAERRRLIQRVIDRLGRSEILRGVPGFYLDQDGTWTCRAVPPGIMVPVPDFAGRIQGYQVRLDRSGPSGARYLWYSSRGRPGGISTGTPVAFWEPDLTTNSTFVITEGSLKAAIAAWHLAACTIGVAGVATWRGALDLLPRGIAVAIAYDADSVVNPHVARHERDLARHLFWNGHPVSIARWVPECKGIDDALLAGASIDLRNWPGGGPPARLRDPAQPAEATLAEASE